MAASWTTAAVDADHSLSRRRGGIAWPRPGHLTEDGCPSGGCEIDTRISRRLWIRTCGVQVELGTFLSFVKLQGVGLGKLVTFDDYVLIHTTNFIGNDSESRNLHGDRSKISYNKVEP